MGGNVCSNTILNCQALFRLTLMALVNKYNNNLYYNSPYGFCLSLSLSLSLSVLLIWGLYRPSSEPIALRNVLKCPTRHTLHIIRFWHFSSLLSLQKTQKTQFYATVL